MTDQTAIAVYRKNLAKASRQNSTGLADNVWAMLQTLEHYFAITNQSYADNRQDIRRLEADVHKVKTSGDAA